MRWEDLSPEQKNSLVSGMRLMLSMFKDWYRTGLMQKITPEALTRADGVFGDLILDPAPLEDIPVPGPQPIPNPVPIPGPVPIDPEPPPVVDIPDVEAPPDPMPTFAGGEGDDNG